MRDYSKALQEEVRGTFFFQEPLKRHTSFQIGGKTPLLYIPDDEDEFTRALCFLHQERIPYRLMGLGSNLLVRDEGVKEVVIALKKSRPVERVDATILRSYAGTSLSRLMKKAKEEELTGCEFLAGIPGTLGGGLTMNAGLKEDWLGSLVKEVVILDKELNRRILGRDAMGFGYRRSSLRSSSFILLEALLELKEGSQDVITKKEQTMLQNRKDSQPLNYPSGGSVFKNPPGDYAGRLIDVCGLKGRVIGDAIISEKHGNFILNRGEAKARDVLKLVKLAKEEVQKAFSISLKLEIEVW